MLAPLRKGPYIKPGGKLEVGQWGMIPPRSKTHAPITADGRHMLTNNARAERLASAWAFAGPWKAGPRCLIPALELFAHGLEEPATQVKLDLETG